MATVGYARVSTGEQELQSQLDALDAAGVDRVFSESASSTSKRPQLQAALDYMRPGDVLVVVAIDRLARSIVDFVLLLERFKSEGIEFRSLTQPFDSTTPEGRMMLTTMASFAQYEREMISRRTRAGLEAARRSGSKAGRRTVLTADVLDAIQSMHARGKLIPEIASTLRISPRSVTRGFAMLRAAERLT